MPQYAVVRMNERWAVFRDGARLSTGMTRLAAIEAAYLQAAAEGDGGETELLVQDEGGELETWAVQPWLGLDSTARSPALA